MHFDYKSGAYKIEALTVNHDGTQIYLDLDNRQQFCLGGKTTVPQVGDVLLVREVDDGLMITVEPACDPVVNVANLMKTWWVAGAARLRRLTYELDGFGSLEDEEQEAIFIGLANATAVGMFIEECKHRNSYNHEKKHVQAIREVAKAHHLLS